MGLSLTILGCCGSFPGLGGACSGYLVRAEGTTVWLDAGSGSMANLQRHVGLGDLDAIVLTHEHPDHWTDIEGYHVAARYGLEVPGIAVYAPEGLQARASREAGRYFDWRTIADGSDITIGALRLRFSRTDHPPETLAVRIDGGGRSLGYSADTGPGWRMTKLGRDLDLALCEATFAPERESHTLHLTARQAGEMAREAGARRLMLTHLWPGNDPEQARADATQAFGADVLLAITNEEHDL